MTRKAEVLRGHLGPDACAEVPPTIANALRQENWTVSLVRVAPSDFYQTTIVHCCDSHKPLLKLILAGEARVLQS